MHTHTTPVPQLVSLFTVESHNTAAQHSLLFLPLCHWVLCSYSQYFTAPILASVSHLWTRVRRCLPAHLWGEHRTSNMIQQECRADPGPARPLEGLKCTQTFIWPFENMCCIDANEAFKSVRRLDVHAKIIVRVVKSRLKLSDSIPCAFSLNAQGQTAVHIWDLSACPSCFSASRMQNQLHITLY